MFNKDWNRYITPIISTPSSPSGTAEIHPKYSNYPSSTGTLFYNKLYYGIYVPKADGKYNNSNYVPTGYTLKESFGETFVRQFNLWTFLAGGGVSIGSAYTTNSARLNSAMSMAGTITSYFKNCTNAWLQVRFYQKGNTVPGKAVIRYGFEMETMKQYAGSYFMLAGCSGLNGAQIKEYQQQFAKHLGESGRYDIKVSFDTKRKQDKYMYYMYLSLSNQWKLRLIKYPGDSIEIVDVANPANGALLDIYDINYDADARLVMLLEEYLTKKGVSILNVAAESIYGKPAIYPANSSGASM